MGKTLDREVTDRAFTHEQRELAWRYWPLARSQARKYVHNIATRDAAYNLQYYMTDWAVDWLFDCVRTYKPELGAKFSTYYMSYLPRYLHRKLGIYLDELHSHKRLNFDLVRSRHPNDMNWLDDYDLLDSFYNEAKISDADRDYLYKWAQSESYDAMASELNVTKQAVHAKVKRILNQIREAIGEM